MQRIPFFVTNPEILPIAIPVIYGTLAYELHGLYNDLNTPVVSGGGGCSVSGGGNIGGGGGGPPLPPDPGADEAPDAGRNPLRFNDGQVGWKFGEHRSDAPGYQNHEQYRELANQIYNDPSAAASSASNGDTLYRVGDNILRVGPDGSFRSLYPVW